MVGQCDFFPGFRISRNVATASTGHHAFRADSTLLKSFKKSVRIFMVAFYLVFDWLPFGKILKNRFARKFICLWSLSHTAADSHHAIWGHETTTIVRFRCEWPLGLAIGATALSSDG